MLRRAITSCRAFSSNGNDKARFRASGAFRANWAFLAIARRGAIGMDAVFLACCTIFQNLTLRADVMILSRIEGERLARQ